MTDSICHWTSASRLHFNPSKTEIVWLGAGHLLQQVGINVIPVLSSAVKVVQSACNLGIILDSQLSLSDHIAALDWFLSVTTATTSYSVTCV